MQEHREARGHGTMKLAIRRDQVAAAVDCAGQNSDHGLLAAGCNQSNRWLSTSVSAIGLGAWIFTRDYLSDCTRA